MIQRKEGNQERYIIELVITGQLGHLGTSGLPWAQAEWAPVIRESLWGRVP